MLNKQRKFDTNIFFRYVNIITISCWVFC